MASWWNLYFGAPQCPSIHLSYPLVFWCPLPQVSSTAVARGRQSGAQGAVWQEGQVTWCTSRQATLLPPTLPGPAPLEHWLEASGELNWAAFLLPGAGIGWGRAGQGERALLQVHTYACMCAYVHVCICGTPWPQPPGQLPTSKANSVD